MKPSIRAFVKEFTSKGAMGSDGYLVEKGLIPLPSDEYKKFKKAGKNLIEFGFGVISVCTNIIYI